MLIDVSHYLSVCKGELQAHSLGASNNSSNSSSPNSLSTTLSAPMLSEGSLAAT